MDSFPVFGVLPSFSQISSNISTRHHETHADDMMGTVCVRACTHILRRGHYFGFAHNLHSQLNQFFLFTSNRTDWTGELWVIFFSSVFITMLPSKSRSSCSQCSVRLLPKGPPHISVK
jgi:hypothetical protein